jgi:excisionase family DNA binding protein
VKAKRKVEVGEVYTLREAAEYLRVGYSTMLRWVKHGTFPAFKVGKFWRVYGRDLLTLDQRGESEEE